MAERYAVSAGNWVAARFDGGTLPGVGDTVHANGFAVTIDTSITVEALSTRAGDVAAAGGSFTTSGAVNVNADSYAGTTSCLVLAANGTQNGNSYGSLTTSSFATTINSISAIQNGNAYGGNGSNRIATDVIYGTINGDAFGGSAANAHGTRVRNFGLHNGNSYGGTAASAHGSILSTRAVHNGNSYGSGFAYGDSISAGAIQNGDSFGGSATQIYGTVVSNGGFQNGVATGGSASLSVGTQIQGGVFYGKAVSGSFSTAHGIEVFNAGVGVVTEIQAGIALPIRLANLGAIILRNGITAASVSNIASAGLFEIAIDESDNYPCFEIGGSAGFTGIRGTTRTLGT